MTIKPFKYISWIVCDPVLNIMAWVILVVLTYKPDKKFVDDFYDSINGKKLE